MCYIHIQLYDTVKTPKNISALKEMRKEIEERKSTRVDDDDGGIGGEKGREGRGPQTKFVRE